MTAKQLDELICCWAMEQGLDLDEEALDILIDRLLKLQEEPEWGLYITHSCHNKRCVNPAHLFEKTGGENVKESIPFRKTKPR